MKRGIVVAVIVLLALWGLVQTQRARSSRRAADRLYQETKRLKDSARRLNADAQALRSMKREGTVVESLEKELARSRSRVAELEKALLQEKARTKKQAPLELMAELEEALGRVVAARGLKGDAWGGWMEMKDEYRALILPIALRVGSAASEDASGLFEALEARGWGFGADALALEMITESGLTGHTADALVRLLTAPKRPELRALLLQELSGLVGDDWQHVEPAGREKILVALRAIEASSTEPEVLDQVAGIIRDITEAK